MLDLINRSNRQHCDFNLSQTSEKVEFHYHGFWPGLDFQLKAERQIARLRKAVPGIQDLRARIERESTGFRMLIFVATAEGPSVVEDVGVTSKKAAQRAFDQLSHRLTFAAKVKFQMGGEEIR